MAVSVGTVIGVIVSNLKSIGASAAKGIENGFKAIGKGMKELGKKIAKILPGMVGAIASFIFRTAGEAVGFLAKNAWFLILAIVIYAVDRITKKPQ